MTSEHPASEAPQMKTEADGTSRPETEQERIDRIKTAMASIENRKEEAGPWQPVVEADYDPDGPPIGEAPNVDPHGLRPMNVISGPDPDAPHGYRNGDPVEHHLAGDTEPRQAHVIGVHGEWVYIRFDDSLTQTRVSYTQLRAVPLPGAADALIAQTVKDIEAGKVVSFTTPPILPPIETPLPGAADVARVVSQTEHAPLEVGEEVQHDLGPRGTVVNPSAKSSSILVKTKDNTAEWWDRDKVSRLSTLTRQAAADRFIAGIIDRPVGIAGAYTPAPGMSIEGVGVEDLPPLLKVAVQRLHSQAIIPTQGKASDAGYDLYSLTEDIILAGGRLLIRTGIALAIPEGYVGLVKPRSGLAVKHGIDVLAGVIDSGYRGEIIVALLNTGDEDYEVAVGERIAQLLVQQVASVAFEEGELPPSERGNNGFGSTGKGAL